MHTKAVDSRIGGQEDSGRTCHVAVVPFAKVTILKYFRVFFALLLLKFLS